MIERLPGQAVTLETRSLSETKVDKKRRYSQILEILAGGKEDIFQQVKEILLHQD